MAIISSIPLIPAHSSVGGIGSNHLASPSSDPSGSLTAFNYTYSQANLYTNSSVAELLPSSTPGTKLTWLSTVNSTSTGAPIPNTAFDFNLTSANLAQAKQEVNWTLTVPQFNCQSCSSVTVSFNFFGSLTTGTNASYILSPRSPPNSTIISSASYTSGSFPAAPNANCPEQSCIDVTKYRGYNVTLSFRFAWNGANVAGMFASVGEVTVSSIGNPISSHSHLMQQTNSTTVVHTDTLSNIKYNNTLTTYVQPGNFSTPRLWWHMEVVSIYYAAGYKINQILINGTKFYPNPPETAFEKDNCVPGPICSVSLLALNVTDFHATSINSTITITARTSNTLTQLSTVSGGVAAQVFTSGAQIGIKVVNQPSIVNASSILQTGSLTISFQGSLGIPLSIQTTSTGGTYTFTLPSTCGFNNQNCDKPLNVTTTFSSGYDLGNATTTFKIEYLQVSLTGTGGTNSLSVTGSLQYGNSTPAIGVNATLFAIDHGIPTNTPYTYNSTGHSAGRLYISNVTLVNGVFTQGQSLILLFTIVNPNATQAYNATLTIEHDWLGPQRHNMTATIHLGLGDALGDFAFTNSTVQTFQATISFTASGVQVQINNFPKNSSHNYLPNPLTMSQGTSPVLPNAPHPGLFNITIASMIGNTALSSPNSLLSPPYAYVSPSFAPARYLYSSPTFTTTAPNGAFSASINTNHILGAQNLTVFVLARNAVGIVVINTLPSSIFSQSTALIPTANSIGPIAEGQTATATLNLKSNSTLSNGITETITVNLFLQGNGLAPKLVGTPAQVTIKPGQSQTVQISFTAPTSIGSYTLTFSSPEYGGVLTSETVQVTIAQGYLQFLLPAAIGIVIGIVVLGAYLVRGRGIADQEPAEETTKKAPTAKPKTAPDTNSPTKSLTRTEDARV